MAHFVLYSNNPMLNMVATGYPYCSRAACVWIQGLPSPDEK